MRFTFTPDHAGIERLARGEGIRDLINRKTDRVLAAAESSAPRVSGDYARSLGSNNARMTVEGWQGEVYSTDPFWHLVEFGSINNPPHRTLSSAVTAAGLDFKDSR